MRFVPKAEQEVQAIRVTSTMTLQRGHWLVILPDGRLQTMDPEKFRQTYRPADEAPEPAPIEQPKRRRARKRREGLVAPGSCEEKVLQACVTHFAQHNREATTDELRQTLPDGMAVSARLATLRSKGLVDRELRTIHGSTIGFWLPTEKGMEEARAHQQPSVALAPDRGGEGRQQDGAAA